MSDNDDWENEVDQKIEPPKKAAPARVADEDEDDDWEKEVD